ncbi:patatin-like phospholipase family protein [Lacimicrobium sp. SS2-24]|uniref:patatin-like phospholipase family protein n=1 Tax=Lacimicrobium sp. SS2-24 TaxID=2005569 RepID=UPI001AEF719C|nr:patatin-like phospholipase family protein [Lacimicrobium sp. SS2-24]
MAIGESSKIQEIIPIFSGGGTRLPAHIGILAALKDLEIGFRHLVGVSGGSIVSALYSAGMPLSEIRQLALETNFRQFRGFSLIRLLRDGGLSSGDKFEKWMDRQLKSKTFEQLELDLHIVATDVNGGGPVIFNRVNSPTMRVSQAVRFSMSIPLIFSFKSYKEHLLVDGAILSEDALFRDWAGDGTPSVCFRLKSENEFKPLVKRSWIPLTQYILLLIRTFMTALSREYVNASYWHNTVVINTGTLSAVDFDMTAEQKDILFELGYETAKSILPTKISPFFDKKSPAKSEAS